MPFTISNIQAMETALKQAAGALLAQQQVDLYQGATVEVKLHVGTRRANETDITGGAVSDTQLVATIWWTGVRHAVDRSIVASPAGNKVFYKARLQG